VTKPRAAGLCSYQGNFDRLAVGFGQLVQMSEVNRFDADFQQVDNIGRNAGQLFDLCQRQVRADSGIAQLARNAVPDFDDFVIFGCHYVQLLQCFVKTKPPSKESGGVGNCSTTVCLFARKAAYIAPSSLAGGYIKVRTKEFPHSAAGLTASVGRNDYKG